MPCIQNKLFIDNQKLDWAGRKVLMRVDFNVPIENGQVQDNQRIVATLPTIRYLLDHKVQTLILMSHLGRPDGKYVPSLSLMPIALELENLLEHKVTFIEDIYSQFTIPSKEGSIILLENLRFHIEEEKKIKRDDGIKEEASKECIVKFIQLLSNLGDIYVNDAFGTMHRAHTSITDIELSTKVGGLLVKKELQAFGPLLAADAPKIDLLVLGGAKVADKIKLFEHLIPRVRKILIGGGMAFTFIKKINSVSIGSSIFDQAGYDHLDSIMQTAKENNVEIVLPCDYIITDNVSKPKNIQICQGDIPDGWAGVDIGPACIECFRRIISELQPKKSTILWNGPVGVFEKKEFANGTKEIIRALAVATAREIRTIVGGGDSSAAIAMFAPHSKDQDFYHVSTGGGATLELLEGKMLPGIAVLSDETIKSID